MNQVKAEVKQNSIVLTLLPPCASNVALVREVPGRKYRANDHAWTAPATASAAESILNLWGGENVRGDDAFSLLVEQSAGMIAAQAAKEADDLPQPELRKNDMWKHQLRAYHFAYPLKAACLYMGMGSGKSKVVVDLAINRDHRRVLIVAPKSVITGDSDLRAGYGVDSLAVWPREFYKFAGHDRWKCWNDTRGTCERRAEKMLEFVDLCDARGDIAVVLVNYEAAWREDFAEAIYKARFDLVVLDESHKAKSSNGTASRFLGKLGGTVPYRLALTGTLMPHSPMDLFGQYRFLDKGVFGTSFTAFRARYAVMGGYQGHQITGYQHEDELREKAERLYYHVGSEVLDLPEAVHTYRVVTLSPETMRAYKQMETTFIADVGAGRIVASNALSKLLRLQQITSGYLPREDSDDTVMIGTEKLDALRDVLDDLEPREPVVVFCRFRHDLDQIAQAARLCGRTSAELSGRLNQLAEWQRGSADVLAVQIQAGGVGIDLTRARYCVYLSMGYNLGDYLQSLARTHRPGQTRSVVYIHLVADHTIDQKVYDALQKRQDVIEEIFHNLIC